MINAPRDEMAIRKIYEHLIKNKSLTTVFRPGDRLFPNNPGWKLGEKIKIRIIDIPGSNKHDILPKFLSEIYLIKIKNICCKPLGELTKKDFEGSSPDVQKIEQLKWHLGLIYNKKYNDFSPKTLVTRIHFNYL